MAAVPTSSTKTTIPLPTIYAFWGDIYKLIAPASLGTSGKNRSFIMGVSARPAPSNPAALFANSKTDFVTVVSLQQTAEYKNNTLIGDFMRMGPDDGKSYPYAIILPKEQQFYNDLTTYLAKFAIDIVATQTFNRQFKAPYPTAPPISRVGTLQPIQYMSYDPQIIAILASNRLPTFSLRPAPAAPVGGPAPIGGPAAGAGPPPPPIGAGPPPPIPPAPVVPPGVIYVPPAPGLSVPPLASVPSIGGGSALPITITTTPVNPNLSRIGQMSGSCEWLFELK
jgi:hypothetical protein